MESDTPEVLKLIFQEQEQNRAKFRIKNLSYEELVAAHIEQSKKVASFKAEIERKDNQIKNLEAELAELKAREP